MSKDYLDFMKQGRANRRNEDISAHTYLRFYSSDDDDSAKFTLLEMEGNAYSTNDSTDSKWRRLKLNGGSLKSGISKTTVESSTESQTLDKSTDMKSLIERQKSRYVRQLQREIRWLEKVEKILLENQNKNAERKKKKKKLSPMKYQPLEINIRNKKLECEKRKNVKNWIEKNDPDYCICSCHQINASEDQTDRYFVSIPTEKKEKTKMNSVKPILGKTIRKVDFYTTASNSNLLTGQMIANDRVKSRTPGISWFVPMEESKPWLQTRGPGDGSHSNVLSRNAQPDGNEIEASVQLSLQDAISYFKGNFILRSQARQQKIGIAARDRKHRAQLNYIYLTELREQRFTNPEPETENLHRPQRRIFSHREMREQTERIYKKLPEVKEEKDKQQRMESAKTHRLMAKMFKRKIQEKALKGKVTYTLTERIQHGLWDL